MCLHSQVTTNEAGCTRESSIGASYLLWRKSHQLKVPWSACWDLRVRDWPNECYCPFCTAPFLLYIQTTFLVLSTQRRSMAITESTRIVISPSFMALLSHCVSLIDVRRVSAPLTLGGAGEVCVSGMLMQRQLFLVWKWLSHSTLFLCVFVS